MVAHISLIVGAFPRAFGSNSNWTINHVWVLSIHRLIGRNERPLADNRDRRSRVTRIATVSSIHILRNRAFEISHNFQPPLVWEKTERHRVEVVRVGTPRWPDPPNLHGQKLRRWTSHRPPLKDVLDLAADHPAVVEGRTIFPTRVFDLDDGRRVLIPGENSRKIGGHITTGSWKGSRLFTLSLEERATCQRSSGHWRSCYTNHMPFTKRLRHGPALVEKIEHELIQLTEQFPEGVVIRTHVSGDFWSVGYVRQWARWLRRFGGR